VASGCGWRRRHLGSCTGTYEELGSSGSTVSGYGLDDRATGVRSPAGARDFSSNLCVQTGSGAHPASCTVGTGGPFTGIKRGQGVTLTTHPHLVPRSRPSRSYTFFPPCASIGVLWDWFTLYRYLCRIVLNTLNKLSRTVHKGVDLQVGV
jgi:hypothetical protein